MWEPLLQRGLLLSILLSVVSLADTLIQVPFSPDSLSVSPRASLKVAIVGMLSPGSKSCLSLSESVPNLVIDKVFESLNIEPTILLSY